MKRVIEILAPFAAWLGTTPLNKIVATTPWIIPSIQVVHILAVAFTLAAVMIVNLRVFGLIEADQPIAVVSRRFTPTIPFTLVILALTGFILISGEPTRAIFRTAFWLKMGMIFVGTALALNLDRSLRGSDIATARWPLRAQAFASASLWLAVVVAGRWIGYANGWAGSPQ